MRRERRIHECFPEGKHLIKLFSKDDCVADVSDSCTQKQISQRILKVTDFNGVKKKHCSNWISNTEINSTVGIESSGFKLFLLE